MDLLKLIYFLLPFCFSYNEIIADIPASDISLINLMFWIKLYENIGDTKDNLLYSPFNVHSMLSLVYTGTAGGTTKILNDTLFLPESKTVNEYKKALEELNLIKGTMLDLATKVFVQQQYKLNDEFRLAAENQFLSEVENVDFEQKDTAAKHINDWVKVKTSDIISDLIKPDDLDDGTRLVAVSANFFIGNWLRQFNPIDTKEAKFYLSEKDSVTCQMMYMEGELSYWHDEILDAEVVRIPYKDEKLTLLVFVPLAKTGIYDLEGNLMGTNLWATYQNLSDAYVNLWLPKFKIEAELDLEDTLTNLGMGVLFSDEANFTNMVNTDEPLKVDKVIQKAFIEVNELGTEDIAATAGTITRRKGIEIRADHPFVFMVMYKHEYTLLPLFIGKLNRP